jgi:hypothetical protein
VKKIEGGVSLGEMIQVFYEEYLALYGDEELAAVAAAATINELLAATSPEEAPPEGQRAE